MDDVLQKLLAVQDKDERIFNLQKMIDSVPGEKEKISEDLQGAEQKVSEAKEKLLKVQSKINDIESSIQTARSRITELNTKSSTVKKNEEYRAILDQIEAINSRISDSEDQQLELMDQVDDAKEAFNYAQKQKDAGDARIKAAQADLDVRETNCQAQIDKIKAERDELAATVPIDIRNLYDRLSRQQKKGNPFRKGVVPIIDNSCGSCHLTVPPDLRLKAQAANEISTCGTCGAILYVES